MALRMAVRVGLDHELVWTEVAMKVQPYWDSLMAEGCRGWAADLRYGVTCVLRSAYITGAIVGRRKDVAVAATGTRQEYEAFVTPDRSEER